MLVRWSEIPEADRNGLVLGYRVSPGYKARRPGLCMGFPTEVPCPRDPPGPRSLPSESTQGICLVAHPPVTMASWDSSLGGGPRVLGAASPTQEAMVAPQASLSSDALCSSFHYLREFLPKLHPTHHD